jgi:hypothetical protein
MTSKIEEAAAIGRMIGVLDDDAATVRAIGYYNRWDGSRGAYPRTVETLAKLAEVRKQLTERLRDMETHNQRDETNE